MKASELRIGNICGMPSSETETVITSMDISDIENGYKNRLPIRLTEEWLVKFGFLKTSVPMKFDLIYTDYRMGQFVLFILPNKKVEIEFFAAHNDIEERGYLKSVKHVHELQNLYFALTEQELTLKS